MKICNKCKVKKPKEDYYFDNKTFRYLRYCKECQNKQQADWMKLNPQSTRDYQRSYSKRFPEKIKAGKKIEYAIKTNKIIRKPCLICGLEKSEGHHPDYSKPLEVVWLCRRHHLNVHNKKLEIYA